MEFLQLTFLLLGGHAVGDFALQTEFMAANKSRLARERFTPEQKQNMETIWPWLLSAHAMHHGLIVYFITHSFWACFLETAAHTLIDFGKGERWYSFHTDQFFHILTKLLWAALICSGVL